MKRSYMVLMVFVAALVFALWFFPPPVRTSDSYLYLSAAEHIKEGRGVVVYTEFPPDSGYTLIGWSNREFALTLHPPLYPLTLSILDAESINALAYAATITLTAGLFRRVVRRPLVVAFGVLSVAFAPPMLEIHLYIWSEPLFIALSTGILVLLRPRPSFIQVAGIAALVTFACLQRYAGVVWIGVIGLWLCFDAFLYSSLFSPSGSADGSSVTSTPTEPPSGIALPPLRRKATSFMQWQARQIPSWFGRFTSRCYWRSFWQSNVLLLCAATYAVLHWIFVAWSRTQVPIDALGNRLLSPLFIPLALILWKGVASLMPTTQTTGSPPRLQAKSN